MVAFTSQEQHLVITPAAITDAIDRADNVVVSAMPRRTAWLDL